MGAGRSARPLDRQVRAVKLHSRPRYYGAYVVLWTALPALVFVLAWAAAEPIVVSNAGPCAPCPRPSATTRARFARSPWASIDAMAHGVRQLTAEELAQARGRRGPTSSSFSSRRAWPSQQRREPYMIEAAVLQNRLSDASRQAAAAGGLLLAVLGFLLGLLLVRARSALPATASKRVDADRSRRRLHRRHPDDGRYRAVDAVRDAALLPSVPPHDSSSARSGIRAFPRGREGGAQGQFGLLPLLWGTLYISFVALLVAVPVGLFAAIYMSEYAEPQRARPIAKPLLEILAGIPTIVYGFFALITFGPFLRDPAAASASTSPPPAC